MPEEPQISFVDNVAPQGPVGFYYSSRGGQAIYRWVKVESLEVPIVDFNGDGTVNIKDLLKMVRCWGQDEPSVDLVRDGTIDDKDLEVLMDYWQQDLDDRTLVAHWKLDETEGLIACDSAGGHNGTILGLPAWRPAGGAVDGALELNGTTFVVADNVLSPSEGAFSVFAWVKGGAPGQVMASQQTGVDWLLLDPATATLTTELQSGSRNGGALCSDAVIADGNWHRVGFVWDGSHRRLYVDDRLAAEDTDVSLAKCHGGLNLGRGKLMAAPTMFTGLIDDVRIYTRAIQP